MAAVVLAYVFAIVLAGGGHAGVGAGQDAAEANGLGFGFLVLVPFLAATSLAQGLQKSLHPAGRPRRRLRQALVTSASLIPLAAVVVVVVFWRTPWPVALLVTLSTTLPLVVLAAQSARRARNWGVRRPRPAWQAPLSIVSRTTTVVLGLWLGAIAALSGTTLIVASGFTVIAFFCAVIVTQNSRWGLPWLAGEWGRKQWAAFGCSYLLALGLAVLLARTSWDLAVVSSIGGIGVAAPLVIAAFRPAPVWVD